MIWCVCLDRSGERFQLINRLEREIMVQILIELKIPIPTYVAKVFSHKYEAEKYVEQLKSVNHLIKQL